VGLRLKRSVLKTASKGAGAALVKTNWKCRLSTSFKGVYYPFFIIPILVAVVSFWIIAWQMPMESYHSWFVAFKIFWETKALQVLIVAAAVAAIRVVFTEFAPFPLWLLGLTVVFLMREIHWDFMSEGVYVGVIILLVIAWLQYDLMREYFQSRFFLTMFAMVFLTYFIGVTFDAQWWTKTERMDNVGQLAEEVVEVFGHLLIVIMTLFTCKKPALWMKNLSG
jgi:hypothetical protein